MHPRHAEVTALHAKSFIIGLVAGIGGGLVSLGGGTLVIPMLMGWMKMAPVAARGTAIAVSLFTAGMGAFVYGNSDMLDLPVAIWVALPSLIIAPLAAGWSENWPARRLKTGFGLVVILGGILVMFRDEAGIVLSVSDRWEIPYLLLVGLLEGLVAGVIGISGGPILAPLFVLGLGMPQQLAQGCSLAARLPAVATGAWENWHLGNIQTGLIPGLALGGLAGAWLGSRTALWLPEHSLRFLFAIFLILLGGHYLLQGFFPHQPGKQK
ncbi:sulfite exporter TauE/SafE family protein [Thiolapillus sp.]